MSSQKNLAKKKLESVLATQANHQPTFQSIYQEKFCSD